jgi:SAM-dependent methyltransferase
MNLSGFFELRRLAWRRLRSEQDYRAFQAFQARQLIDYLKARGVVVRDRSVLDLGSGVAGYSQEFALAGARVISLDLVTPRQTHVEEMMLVQANAVAVPLSSGAFDIVFCASLIEHVAEPEVVLAEIERVLKPRGYAYISFPPYYSPTGGHEFAPFHYLGERLALRLVRRRAVVPAWVYQLYNLPEQPASFAHLSDGWGLYKLTIHKFRRLLAQTQLRCRDVSTRYFPVSFIRWPLLGEILTWHAQFLVVKPPQGTRQTP